MDKKLFVAVTILTLAFMYSLHVNAQRPADETYLDPALFENDVVDGVPGDFVRQNRQPFIAHSETDADGDGLDDTDELTLGTDPNNIDSDCDYVDDKTEVGTISAPLDSDKDGLIDALESLVVDSGNSSGLNDQNDPTVGPQVSCARFVPFAIRYDDSDTTRLEVQIVGGTDVTTVSVVPVRFLRRFIKLDGISTHSVTEIELFDDGSHRDRIAGDGIWTRGGVSAKLPQSSSSPSTYGPDFAQVIKLMDNSTLRIIDRFDVIRGFAGIPLLLVNPEVVQATTMYTNVQLSSHLINIIDPLVSLQIKQGGLARKGLLKASHRFYQQFDNLYDFLIFQADSPAVEKPHGVYYSVKNDTVNIGKEIFDNSGIYGRAGKLQGVIFINFGGDATLHELMHRWGTPKLTSLGMHQCLPNDFSHWGVAGVGRGLLGGFDAETLVDNGDGTYTVNRFGRIANNNSYVPLERYLAGFIDSSEVPPITIPINVNCASLDDSVPNKITFQADGIKTITIDEIIKELGGSRFPAYPNAQRAFKTAMIVVSQQPLNQVEMAFFNEWSKLYGADVGDGFYKSFKEASGGVASMDTTVMQIDAPTVTPGPTSTPKPSTYLPMLIR